MKVVIITNQNKKENDINDNKKENKNNEKNKKEDKKRIAREGEKALTDSKLRR